MLTNPKRVGKLEDWVLREVEQRPPDHDTTNFASRGHTSKFKSTAASHDIRQYILLDHIHPHATDCVRAAKLSWHHSPNLPLAAHLNITLVVSEHNSLGMREL